VPAAAHALEERGDRRRDAGLDDEVEDRPALVVSNDTLELTVMAEGGALANLILRDDPAKLSPLWNPARIAREAEAMDQAKAESEDEPWVVLGRVLRSRGRFAEAEAAVDRADAADHHGVDHAHRHPADLC
jgi:cytochrome c-type biogenesis protein CcmH/NrfG